MRCEAEKAPDARVHLSAPQQRRGCQIARAGTLTAAMRPPCASGQQGAGSSGRDEPPKACLPWACLLALSWGWRRSRCGFLLLVAFVSCAGRRTRRPHIRLLVSLELTLAALRGTHVLAGYTSLLCVRAHCRCAIGGPGSSNAAQSLGPVLTTGHGCGGRSESRRAVVQLRPHHTCRLRVRCRNGRLRAEDADRCAAARLRPAASHGCVALTLRSPPRPRWPATQPCAHAAWPVCRVQDGCQRGGPAGGCGQGEGSNLQRDREHQARQRRHAARPGAGG